MWWSASQFYFSAANQLKGIEKWDFTILAKANAMKAKLWNLCFYNLFDSFLAVANLIKT